ncbi:zinc finger CCHC domain-containing protein 17 isoform X3 [Aphelocoma coerulescens]
MSSCRVDKPSEIVDVGDKVWVKLIGKEMKDDKLKLSLSMKVVHQGTGKDLDPNNVCLDQDERRKRTFRDYTSQKITLEAVLNTVCKKCGCKGHFAKECFMQPGGTKYSLIPEEEEEEVAAAGHEGDKKISKAEESSKKRKKLCGSASLERGTRQKRLKLFQCCGEKLHLEVHKELIILPLPIHQDGDSQWGLALLTLQEMWVTVLNLSLIFLGGCWINSFP